MKSKDNPQFDTKSNSVSNCAKLAARNKQDADEFAQVMRLVLLKFSARRMSLRKMAAKLEEIGMPTSRGGRWHSETVRRLLLRLGPEFEQEANELRDARATSFFEVHLPTSPMDL